MFIKNLKIIKYNTFDCLKGVFMLRFLFIVVFSINMYANEIITIGTGGINGTYFPTGGSICRLFNTYKNETNTRCTVESTLGSVYNINTIKNGGLELGIAQSDIVYDAFNGLEKFDKHPYKNLRVVMSIYPELFTLVTKKSANINTLYDIKDKKINIGNSGSGNEASAKILFEESGIKLGDLSKVSKLKATNVNEALSNSEIDGYFYMVGHPTASIKEISYTTDISIVPLQGQNIDNLIKKYPYYTKSYIKAGLYNGIDKDINTYGVKALLVTSADVDEKTIYYIVKSILENFDKFKHLHPAYKNITRESLLEGISAPLHKGAEKYFREIKLIK